jgi:hypothetical protein
MSHDPTPPRDPFLGNHYVRNPQHAEEIPTQALLEHYIQYVVPHLPRTPTDMVDD